MARPASKPRSRNGRANSGPSAPTRRRSTRLLNHPATAPSRSQGKDEQPEGGEIDPGATAVAKPQIHPHRPQIAHERKRVLLLGDPRHGFHMHGMEREEQSRVPGPRHGKPLQDPAAKHRRSGVEQQRHQVITERVVAPEAVLNPEKTVQQRIILLSRPNDRPDAAQTIERLEVGPGHIVAVVPDEAPGKRRQKGDQGQSENHRPHARRPAAERVGINDFERCLGSHGKPTT